MLSDQSQALTDLSLDNQSLADLSLQLQSYSLTGMLRESLVYYLATFVVFSVYACPLIAYIGAVANGAPVGLGTAIGRGLKRAPAFLVASVVFTLIVLVGTLLFVVPGAWASVALTFCFFAIVLENQGVVASFETSHRLVRGRWWHTAIVVTAAGLVVIGIYIGAVVLAAIVATMALGAGTLLDDITRITNLVQLVVAPILNAVLMPLMTAMFLVAYSDLKAASRGDAES